MIFVIMLLFILCCWMFFNITERHKRCCHIENHPQSAKSPYGMWGE